MLPIMCNQPPCMNIDVIGVSHEAESLSTQTAFGPIGTRTPAGAVCSSSPGISPSAAN